MSDPAETGAPLPEPTPTLLYALPYELVFAGTPDPENIARIHKLITAAAEFAGAVAIRTNTGLAPGVEASSPTGDTAADVNTGSETLQTALDTPFSSLISERTEGGQTIKPSKELIADGRGAWVINGLKKIDAPTPRGVLTLGLKVVRERLQQGVPRQFGGPVLDTLLDTYLKTMCPDITPQDEPTAEFVATFCENLDQVDARGIPGMPWPATNKRLSLQEVMRRKSNTIYNTNDSMYDTDDDFTKAQSLAAEFAERFSAARATDQSGKPVEAE